MFTTQRVNQAGLRMIKMGRCRFINFNKFTTLVVNVGDRGGCACVEAEGTWEISVLLFSLAVNLKQL